MTDQQVKDDMRELMRLPAFNRFLFRVIQKATIFGATTDGSDGRNLIREGRRQLGLEVLAEADEAQPVQSPDGIPLLTIMQVFREAAQQQPEKPHGKYSRNAELDEQPDD